MTIDNNSGTLLANAMHYVISCADKERLNLGATLLCKIIFFAEL
jgi:hypothetical protein